MTHTTHTINDLAVIIITWNTRDLTLNALRSLYDDLATTDLSADVYVVDNASSDYTTEAVQTRFPQVHLITSPQNLGFVGGNNHALHQIGFDDPNKAHTLPRAVYLLNPDTITQADATKTLYDYLMHHEQVGLVGAQLAYEDGSFQHGAFAFPGLRQLWAEFFPTPGRFIEGRFNGRYPKALYAAGQPFSVDFVLGATMMLKREVVQQVGVFDARFFMYCEEVDLAWRIRKAGWGVYCVPAARVTHLSGSSTAQVRPQATLHLWTSRLRLFQKHYPPWKLRLARWLVAAGLHRKMRQTQADPSLSDADKSAMTNTYRHLITLYRQGGDVDAL